MRGIAVIRARIPGETEFKLMQPGFALTRYSDMSVIFHVFYQKDMNFLPSASQGAAISPLHGKFMPDKVQILQCLNMALVPFRRKSAVFLLIPPRMPAKSQSPEQIQRKFALVARNSVASVIYIIAEFSALLFHQDIRSLQLHRLRAGNWLNFKFSP